MTDKRLDTTKNKAPDTIIYCVIELNLIAFLNAKYISIIAKMKFIMPKTPNKIVDGSTYKTSQNSSSKVDNCPFSNIIGSTDSSKIE